MLGMKYPLGSCTRNFNVTMRVAGSKLISVFFLPCLPAKNGVAAWVGIRICPAFFGWGFWLFACVLNNSISASMIAAFGGALSFSLRGNRIGVAPFNTHSPSEGFHTGENASRPSAIISTSAPVFPWFMPRVVLVQFQILATSGVHDNSS